MQRQPDALKAAGRSLSGNANMASCGRDGLASQSARKVAAQAIRTDHNLGIDKRTKSSGRRQVKEWSHPIEPSTSAIAVSLGSSTRTDHPCKPSIVSRLFFLFHLPRLPPAVDCVKQRISMITGTGPSTLSPPADRPSSSIVPDASCPLECTPVLSDLLPLLARTMTSS
ncbi:hypothetical protein HPB50_003780 [Hyalomma asiaticum]|uniref:Uncharacterized protein n=1 Tax=Hyalomma asiaticum TaxID=266040 RepID=A0ACB7S6V1_HYAAI|nr:hypothetical protein HPB50_003780 [Hyalomma asiaticum]